MVLPNGTTIAPALFINSTKLMATTEPAGRPVYPSAEMSIFAGAG